MLQNIISLCFLLIKKILSDKMFVTDFFFFITIYSPAAAFEVGILCSA